MACVLKKDVQKISKSWEKAPCLYPEVLAPRLLLSEITKRPLGHAFPSKSKKSLEVLIRLRLLHNVTS